MKRAVAVAVLILASACQPARVPPANTMFDGLPITGSVPFAKRLGFSRCLQFNAGLRCRRTDLHFMGEGPYSAAVDAVGGDGGGGFSQLTLWHETDQFAVTLVGKKLLASGWTLCRTGSEDRGDQSIYRKPGAKVRISIDASYWGKRRLRILPELGQPTGKCW